MKIVYRRIGEVGRGISGKCENEKIVSGKREGGRGKVELGRRKWSEGSSAVNGKRNKKKKKKKKRRK